MATRIRLRRVGRKKQPSYRIVVIDKQKARDGSFVELLGHYNPRTEPATIEVDREKARAWLSKGATPSDTVRSLLKQAGVFRTPDQAQDQAPDQVPVETPDQAQDQTPDQAPVETPGQASDAALDRIPDATADES